jgi:DNA-binding transcriptional regulator YiaG
MRDHTSTTRRRSKRQTEPHVAREVDQLNLAEPAAAAYLNVSEAVLRYWRRNGGGPQFFRAGAKLIRYRRRDLDVWIEAHLSTTNTQPMGTGDAA